MVSRLYEAIGQGYRRSRRPDPRIQARLHAALGGAASVLNVGAGTGSYEPADRRVVAVEPAQVMLAQRPAGAAPAVRAGMSSLAQLAPEAIERGARRLRRDLESGRWDARYGALRRLAAYDAGYRLVIAGVDPLRR